MESGTIWGIIGTILAFLGLVTAYIFYRLSIERKEPCWAITSNNLIRDNIYQYSGLEVFFNKIEVESLTVSRILFWNKGRRTILKDDIVSIYPIKIICTESTRQRLILEIKLLELNKSSNNFSVTLDEDLISGFITFDYLDRMNGASLQVIHTGDSSDSIQLIGEIMGSEPIKRITDESIKTWKKLINQLYVIWFTIIYFFLIGVWYFPKNYFLLNRIFGNREENFYQNLSIIFILVISFFCALFLASISRKKLAKSRFISWFTKIPIEFSTYFDPD